MKTKNLLQVWILIFCFSATATFSVFGEKLEKTDTKEATEENSAEKESDEEKKEEEIDPAAEFEKQVTAFEEFVKEEVYASKLPSGKRAQLQAMAVAAYRENNLEPLWAKSVDLKAVNKELIDFLELHGFKEITLTFAPRPDIGGEDPVPHEDLLVTLSTAETSLLLKQGPDTISEWPNWSFGDHPGIKSSNDHWDDVTTRFGETAAGSEDPIKVAEAFVPQNRIYQRIFEEIQQFGNEAEAPELQVKKLVKVGYKFEQAPELAKYLAAEGYLDEAHLTGEEPEKVALEVEEEDADSPKEEAEADEAENEEEEKEPGFNEGIFTQDLSDALKNYQKLNGLQADGILGPKTAARIANQDEEEAEALHYNLHRARRFPDNPGDKFLHANIPSGEVYGFENGEETIRMRIVFGKNIRGQRTPIFRDEMEQVVFRPYWNVPYNIAVSEGNYSDPGYLARNGFKIISSSGRELPISTESLSLVRSRKSFVRQDAGTNNALGIVKFLFPNKHAVYFHDTPYKHYFRNSYRAKSHGCVRLEKPEEMANWVLGKYEEWDSAKISSALNGRRREVNLDESIPVYITYFTALPDATQGDKIGFYQDIYSYDRPGAVVDAPGPKPKVIELPDEKPRSSFFLFKRNDRDRKPSPPSSLRSRGTGFFPNSR
ncbi:MAG: L,D-transpeptidase family protein [Verrucomicrobiales bacterium]|nr:L,D-transpeptidase family protein [Verrucomicrobiales bacterium]